MAGDDLTVHDEQTYCRFYNDLERIMQERFDFTIDHQVYHNSNTQRLLFRKINLDKGVNNVMIRIEWDKLLWDPRRIMLAKTFAEIIADDLAHAPLPDNLDILKKKDIGFDGYDV